MTTPELIKWLRENSSGIYRPSREAADLIARLAEITAEHDARAKMANFARCACDHCKAIRTANAPDQARLRPSPEASCSVCVHGHDLDPREGSMVVCTPQHKAHDPSYCCTGFRCITLAEIDERTAAKVGTPNAGSQRFQNQKEGQGHD